MTGLSASFISMVETGQTELTVGRLRALADFYEVSMADLVPGRETDGPVVLRRDDRSAIESPDRKVRTESLSTWNSGDMSGGFVHLEVGAQMSGLPSQAGSMCVLVLSGQLAIQFADDTSVALGRGRRRLVRGQSAPPLPEYGRHRLSPRSPSRVGPERECRPHCLFSICDTVHYVVRTLFEDTDRDSINC